jgi:hypothetical protein
MSQTDAFDLVEPTADALSRCLVLLLKGVLYRDDHPDDWATLLRHQVRARDHFALICLDLIIDDAEGWAFVRSRPTLEDAAPDAVVPRLVTRRELSFPVSVLLALLRKRLAEADAGGGDTRLVLSRSELIELLRSFLPESADEARLFKDIDVHIGKVVDLGFLRRLGTATGATEASYEVRRIIRAFVDAQWLTELDERLQAYRAALSRDLEDTDDE